MTPMNKTDAIIALNRNPDDREAQLVASRCALEEENWNVAFNLLSRLVRARPEAIQFRNLSYVASKLKLARTTALYLLAAKNAHDVSEELKGLIETDWAKLKTNLLASSEPVASFYKQLDANKPLKDKQLASIKKESNLPNRLKLYARALSKRAPLPLAYFYCAELLNDGKASDSYDLATATLLHGDTTLGNLLNMSAVMIHARLFHELIPFSQAVVNLYPTECGAWTNLGGSFDVAKRPWEAIHACEHALKLNPVAIPALNNLGNARKNAGAMVESAAAYRRALEIGGWKDRMILSNYLLALQYSDDFSKEEKAAEHFRFGELFPIEVIEEPQNNKPPRKTANKRDSRLRVGFISADFMSHSCSYFLHPLWSNVKTCDVELVAFHNQPSEDSVTQILKATTDQWVDVSQMNDEQALRAVQERQIDVLIDPAGHTSKNRLAVFGARAAPVQVTWLGHPNTTGLRQMDYRVTDENCDPTGVDHLYTEKLCRLPGGTFGVYQPLVNRISEQNSEKYSVQPPPCLKNGYVTFGSCNNIAKLTRPVIRTWSRILQQAPTSRLLLESPGFSQNEFKKRYVQQFQENGIDPSRIELLERDYRRQYIVYNQIDICLDPFPCNGGTTSFDLLWMGLPLVTLRGEIFVSRMGNMLAKNINKDHWIANDRNEYVEIALSLASSIDELAACRGAQRSLMESSPLMAYRTFSDEFAELLHGLAA